MAIEFLSYASLNEQMALQEHQTVQPHNQMLDYTEISDSNVSKLRNSISIHNRIGHARFGRAPHPCSTSGLYQNLVSGFSALLLTLDFTMHCMVVPAPFKDPFSMSAKLSTFRNSSSSTFVSSITSERSVSNGKSGAQPSMFLIPSAPLASSRKLPITRRDFMSMNPSIMYPLRTPGCGSPQVPLQKDVCIKANI